MQPSGSPNGEGCRMRAWLTAEGLVTWGYQYSARISAPFDHSDPSATASCGWVCNPDGSNWPLVDVRCCPCLGTVILSALGVFPGLWPSWCAGIPVGEELVDEGWAPNDGSVEVMYAIVNMPNFSAQYPRVTYPEPFSGEIIWCECE